MAGGVMMTDNVNSIVRRRTAMTMMKPKSIRLPRIHHAELGGDLSIMITSHENRLASLAETRNEMRRGFRRSAIVDEVAQ